MSRIRRGLSLASNKDDDLLLNQQKPFDKSAKDANDESAGRAILSNMIVPKNPVQADTGIMAKTLDDPLSFSALSVPHGVVSIESMDREAKLSGIIKSPTEDQKAVLDVIKALLTDISKGNKEGVGNEAANPQFKKAEADLLNAVENVLLAQAIPDLMGQGDMANIKAIFSDLNTTKNKILSEYEKSTNRYYENIAKDIAKNMAALQMGNVLTSQLTKEELAKLPPNELNKMLEKIKRQERKTFEEEYILQQEAKYRAVDPESGKKRFEEDMKSLMKDFTGKISNVLTVGNKNSKG